MPAYIPAEIRFFEKIDKHGPIPAHCHELGQCWIWTGGTNGSVGYGRFRLPRQRTTEYAHRFSFRFHGKRLPKGKIVCHRCGNNLCVNPEHLYAGTFSSNNIDRLNHGNQSGGANKGQRHYMAKLSDKQVIEIRQRLSQGATNVSLSKEYRISKTHISKIKMRQAWSHI